MSLLSPDPGGPPLSTRSGAKLGLFLDEVEGIFVS